VDSARELKAKGLLSRKTYGAAAWRQPLWLKELQSYIDFPPLQNPASYNLQQVMQQVREMKSNGLSD